MEYCYDSELGYLRCSFYVDEDGYLIISDALLNDKLDILPCLSDSVIDGITTEASQWFKDNQDDDY